jgi:hypothetical protein
VSQTGTGTETESDAVPVTTDDGDHDRFAHYVIKSDLDASRSTGLPVRALCGKIWMPDRDPSRYPVCPTCKDIAFKMRGSTGP